MPGQEGETGSDDPFQYLGKSFEYDNNHKGGRGIIGRFAGFIQHNAVCFLQGGGVVSVM